MANLKKYVVLHTIIVGLGPSVAQNNAVQGDIVTGDFIESKKVDLQRLIRLGALEEASPRDIEAWEKKLAEAAGEETEKSEDETEDETGVSENPAATSDGKKQAAKTTGNNPPKKTGASAAAKKAVKAEAEAKGAKNPEAVGTGDTAQDGDDSEQGTDEAAQTGAKGDDLFGD